MGGDLVTSAVERRYRRILRLLPASYRENWAEDMVTAYMEQASSGRRTWAERLSVVWLAVRLRLNGAHASPRWLVWYHIAHALALLVLLYQAVAATVAVAFGIAVVTHDPSGGFNPGFLFSFQTLSGLPWVAAFACFVAGGFVAARVFAVLAAASALAFMVAVVAINGFSGTPLGVSDVSRWGWLVLSVIATFVTPSGARASGRVWAVAYIVGSGFVSVLAWRSFSSVIERYWRWTQLGSLVDVASVGLIIAMVIVLVRAWRVRSPHWLFGLAALAGGIAAYRLLRLLTAATPPGLPRPSHPSYLWQLYTLNVTLAILAMVCVAAGLFRWSRIPARTRT
jgi:hypothetical protein